MGVIDNFPNRGYRRSIFRSAFLVHARCAIRLKTWGLVFAARVLLIEKADVIFSVFPHHGYRRTGSPFLHSACVLRVNVLICRGLGCFQLVIQLGIWGGGWGGGAANAGGGRFPFFQVLGVWFDTCWPIGRIR